MSSKLESLKQELIKISNNNKLCIALSDGVDSTVLLKVAIDAGLDVLPVTIITNFFNDEIIENIYETASEFDIKLNSIDVDMFEDARIRNNDKLRCYYCKFRMFSAIKKFANDNGYITVCDGTNADDLKLDRPGLKAKNELEIFSPYASCNITKQEVREIGKLYNLDIATKPSNSCVLTRFPIDKKIDYNVIKKVYKGEKLLHELGFSKCRIRVNDNNAKIQIVSKDESKYLENKQNILCSLRDIGFERIELHDEFLISN